jgi:hypothetical protein
MAADVDNANDGETKSAPMAAEDSPETAVGPSPRAGDAETELVPPATAAAPEHAWSNEEPVTEVLPRQWRSVWTIAGAGLLCAIIVAFVIFGVVAMVRQNHGVASTNPTTPTRSASVPAAPASPPAPRAVRPDDDEFVAIAFSPHSLSTSHLAAAFGTSGTQDQANQTALSLCQAGSGSDDCLLVGAGMFHGCISLAIDPSLHSWANGTGVDAEAALAAALSKLGTPTPTFYTQCSDPPGIIRSRPTPLSSPVPAPAPAAPPMAHGAALGKPCDPSGPTFGYAADGSVLACPSFGKWVQTAGWSGVQELGSPCPSGAGSAVSPSGRGLVCVTSTRTGVSAWQPGP